MSVRCGSEPRPPDGRDRHSSSSSSSSLLSYADGGCTSSAPIPANLHVCHESRSEALRRYRLSFGIARQPGRVFFDPDEDVLYFGPRDGFMASEAQLRTVLTLCCPEELRRVRKVAINDALFWVYESSRRSSGSSIFLPSFAAITGPPSPSCGGEYPPSVGSYRHERLSSQHFHHQRRQHWPGGFGAGGLAHATIATSLLADTLQLLRTRLPGLQELIFVPRDENPLYSGDCCLVEPAMVQSRMARQVREAMAVVFGGDGRSDLDSSAAAVPSLPRIGAQQQRQQQQQQEKRLPAAHPDDQNSGVGSVPWIWRIMALSADPDPPVYGRRVLGWEEDDHSKASPLQRRQRQERQQTQSPLDQEWGKGGSGGKGSSGQTMDKSSQPINHNKRKRNASPGTSAAAPGVGADMVTEEHFPNSSTKAWHRRRQRVGTDEGTTGWSSLEDGMRRARFMQQVEMEVCV